MESMTVQQSQRPGKRSYRLQRRAQKQEETRLRIIEAAIQLHGSVGISRTTMGAIAELAGVQRNTLYSYFPDDAAVGRACSSLWYERNPAPDVATLSGIADPQARLRATLQETHAYFERAHGMLASLARDADHPVVWEATAPLRRQAEERREVVVRAFRLRGARRDRLSAAVELALDFETWRTLIQRRGMDPAAAIDLLAGMVQSAIVTC